MGNTHVKTIEGRKYLYYEYRDKGVKKTRCCGRVDDPESKRKALQAEREELEVSRLRINSRLAEIAGEME